MAKVETAQEKMARLRALREARDGTPAEIAARRRAERAAADRRSGEALEALASQVRARGEMLRSAPAASAASDINFLLTGRR